MTDLRYEIELTLDTLESEGFVDPVIFATQMKFLHGAAENLSDKFPQVTLQEATTILIARMMARAESYIQEEQRE